MIKEEQFVKQNKVLIDFHSKIYKILGIFLYFPITVGRVKVKPYSSLLKFFLDSGEIWKNTSSVKLTVGSPIVEMTLDSKLVPKNNAVAGQCSC